jgi:hypothetical protein
MHGGNLAVAVDQYRHGHGTDRIGLSQFLVPNHDRVVPLGIQKVWPPGFPAMLIRRIQRYRKSGVLVFAT